MSVRISDRYTTIYLMGVDNCLNGALSYVLEREVCSVCVILKNGDSIPAEMSAQGNRKILFMIDSTERDVEKELVALATKEYLRTDAITVALYNLQKGTGIERRAFNKGIKGFFYREDSLPQMLKGLQSLIQGEIWVTRDILVKVALQGRLKTARAVHDKTDLTRREVEILTLLSIGSSNDDIAEKLFISPNTVKTHLYRIFRKIKVPNRFQAALWAAKNL
jgi:LuxR family transcriptional regulator, positive regulator of biofilm formation